jgi:glycosyltransferase involved in cell wall biosynthesis
MPNKKTKILYIWDADYPWDIRVEKICNSLAENGFNVHIAARNLKKLPTYEMINKLHVHRLKPIRSEYLNYIISFPLFFSPYWKKMINRIIEEQKIDIIIVRDLPMAAAGIWAGEKYKIPVIFDMAEDYCAMIQEIWKHKKFHGFNLIVRNPYFAKIIQNYVLKKFDHIMVVVEEAKNLIIEKGVDKCDITVIGNTPLLDLNINCNATLNNHVDIIKNRYSIIYTGGITFDRGIPVVLNAISLINKKINDILFVMVGKGNYIQEINDIIDKKGLQKWVLIVGWVDHEVLYEYIKACKLGIIPHYVTDHIKTTIPNKLFDYMACGIPVIASDAPPMRRIILEEGCGKIFNSGDSIELSDAILSVYESDMDYGANGKQAILNKYNWREDEKRLIRLIKNI